MHQKRHSRQSLDHAAKLRDWHRRTNWSKHRRYDEAGALADEILHGCRIGTIVDHHIWAARFYLYPWMLDLARDIAYEFAAKKRNGELRNPVTAFQNWINRNLPTPPPAKDIL